MKVYAGTSGYSYKEWKGSFYPEKLAAKDMLGFYASKLPAVEINNTFYRMPKAAVVSGWAAEVPEDFRFVLKASKRITHMSRLRETANDSTAFMLEQFGNMGERLGAILFQLPPNMKVDAERLEAFLGTLPEGTRAAFEFRHESWFDEAVYALLRARNAALVVSDAEDASTPWIATADWSYLRLRRAAYSDDEIAQWAERVSGESWGEAFVFFKHEDEGTGPKAAARFLERVS